MTASPSSALSDGQFVKLTMTGFPPAEGVALRQCIASPAVISTDCTAVNSQVLGITNSAGSASTYLPVYAGSDPALKNAGRTGFILCDSTHACVIAGMHDVNNLAKAVYAPITFGPSPDACPAPGANEVLGGGSASPYRAIYLWESTVCRPPASLPVGYTFSNSVDGLSNFINKIADFGAIGPLAPGNPPSGPTFKLAPITTSSVVIAYRIYDRRGPQITDLVLTPDLVAQIFEGAVPNWNASSAINALNPGLQFPSRVVPFARAEHSSETYVFTSWLAATAPGTWTAGAQEIFPLPPAGVTGVTGSAGLGLAVVDPTTDFFGQGNLAFLDSSTAAFYGLPTVQIRRADGSTVAATSDTITRSVADATVNADGTITPNYATTDPLAYPMPMPAYMVAPTNTITPAKGALLAAFLRYAVQSGQLNLPPGYAALPANLVAEALQVARLIPVPHQSPPPTYSPPPVLPPYVPPVQTPVTQPSATPTPPPTCIPRPSPTPPAGESPSPSPSIGPVASPSPSTASADQLVLPPCPRPGTATGDYMILAAQQGRELKMLVQFDDPTASRGFLASIAGLGLLGLVAGACVQLLGRRRRPESPPAPGAE